MATTKSNKSTDSDSEKKVFDVARPGSSDPETGTKPMVIGHKAMTSDPSMIKKDDKSNPENETENDESTEPTIQLSPSKKLTLHPLSDEDKEDKSDSEETNDDKKTVSAEKNNAEAEVIAVNDSPPDEEQDKEKTTNQLEKEHQAEVDKREQVLGELIKSGKFKVAINDSKTFNFRVFATTLLFIAVVLAISLVVLTDLEIIDLGFSLPFDIL